MRRQGLIFLIFVSVLVSSCTTMKTTSLLDKYQTISEIETVIGPPSYHFDNRYVWHNNRQTTEIYLQSTPYTTFSTGYENGILVMLPQTNYYYSPATQYVYLECELTLVTDLQGRLIFKQVVSNNGKACKVFYGDSLRHDLIEQRKLSRFYRFYDFFPYIFWPLVTY